MLKKLFTLTYECYICSVLFSDTREKDWGKNCLLCQLVNSHRLKLVNGIYICPTLPPYMLYSALRPAFSTCLTRGSCYLWWSTVGLHRHSLANERVLASQASSVSAVSDLDPVTVDLCLSSSVWWRSPVLSLLALIKSFFT